MGTHPNGPVHLYASRSTSLLSLISSDPRHYLGERVIEKWPSTTNIPFIFKILSIAKAPPLQAHPDKALAEQLHARDLKQFVDAKHKPEIAVSIGKPLVKSTDKAGVDVSIDDKHTAFTGFVGFRPLEEIKEFLLGVPELVLAVGDSALVDSFTKNPSRGLLKQVYAAKLLKHPYDAPGDVEKEVSMLKERIGKGEALPGGNEINRLMLKMEAEYPGDVGVLATIFFMSFSETEKRRKRVHWSR